MNKLIHIFPYLQMLAPYHKMKPSYPMYQLYERGEWAVSTQSYTQAALLEKAEEKPYEVFEYIGYLIEQIGQPVNEFANVEFKERPAVMGIVNVTPDSFSDGGKFLHVDQAVEHCQRLIKEGAAILDIGGESTRPDAAPVSEEEELNRVIPVIEALKGKDVPISIDTRRAKVMEKAVLAGANLINDVSALEGEKSLEMAAELDVPVILMHMQGTPQTMQVNPEYDHCLLDVFDYLKGRIDACMNAGIEMENICVDPGIGFGKTVEHNMQLLNGLSLFHGLGCAVMLGASRKSFIPKIAGEADAEQRIGGSLAAVLKGAQAGVQIMRVHDVFETDQALKVWSA